MRYRKLGTSDLTISEIGIGSWLTYGVSVERERASACIARAFDHGVNFIDTANMYGRGAAETFLGEELAAYPRESYVLATKVYYPMSDTDRGLSREQVYKQIDASLKRLKTGYVDLYQCHRFDHDTPLEETMDALGEVVKAGKARYIGFSQWSPRRIRAANEFGSAVKFVSSQPQYSMLYRKPEREVFALCRSLGIGQIAYSPLAQGVLTGKYKPGHRPPPGTRASRRKIRRFTADHVLEAVEQLQPIAERHSLTIPQLALAWVLNSGEITSAIIGASRPEQVDHNVGAVGVRLDEQSLRDIDRVLDGAIRR